jgi:hypothetical protein
MATIASAAARTMNDASASPADALPRAIDEIPGEKEGNRLPAEGKGTDTDDRCEARKRPYC